MVGLERWRGRTAVVTGASSGIGAAVAVALADAGLKVIGLARRKNLIEELQKQVTGTGSIVARGCDLTKAEDIAAAFLWIDENHGGTDLLVNNAGIFHISQTTDFGPKPLSDDQVHSTIDLNLKATILCTRNAVSSMKKREFAGHVVIVNSIAGHYVPNANFFNVYPASKHGVTAFCTSLIYELTHFGSDIKVTSLSPGLVATPMAGDISTRIPSLASADVAAALLYVIGTPPHVNITELTIEPVKSARL